MLGQEAGRWRREVGRAGDSDRRAARLSGGGPGERRGLDAAIAGRGSGYGDGDGKEQGDD